MIPPSEFYPFTTDQRWYEAYWFQPEPERPRTGWLTRLPQAAAILHRAWQRVQAPSAARGDQRPPVLVPDRREA